MRRPDEEAANGLGRIAFEGCAGDHWIDPCGLTDSFLALVDEAFRRLLDEPDAHLHVTGFAEGDVAFVLTCDGLEARRRAEVYGSEN